jgi:putative membrane protein
MKNILFRTTCLILLLAVAFAPAYAHHGTAFLTKAMEGNAAEVKMGELAQTKAQDQKVKEFAAMVVKDHTMALDKMQMMLEERKNAKVAPNTQDSNWHNIKLNSMHQRNFDKLSKLSGPDFDREFMRMMTTAHQAAIRDFETHARSHGNAASATPNTRQKPADNNKVDWANDTDTVTFARETLPTLKHHLEQAQMIQKDMKSTPVSQR